MPGWLVLLALSLQWLTVRRVAPLRYPDYDTAHVITFPFDDARLLRPGHRHAGSVWVTPHARPGARLPLYIYLHGLNRDRILRRWMHGSRWDMRTIVGPMAMEGLVGPMAVAVAATTSDSAQHDSTIYPGFDVAGFVDATDRALAPQGFHIDRGRVIFSAHSASGCAMRNGLYAGVGSPAAQTILDLDCCMNANFGRVLGNAPPWQRVIVVYQDYMWNNGRDYHNFIRTFRSLSERSACPMNRVLEHYRMEGIDVHNDIVPVSLRRWLPELVPPVEAPADAPLWDEDDEGEAEFWMRDVP